MKHLLLTTIATLLLIGCNPLQPPGPMGEVKYREYVQSPYAKAEEEAFSKWLEEAPMAALGLPSSASPEERKFQYRNNPFQRNVLKNAFRAERESNLASIEPRIIQPLEFVDLTVSSLDEVEDINNLFNEKPSMRGQESYVFLRQDLDDAGLPYPINGTVAIAVVSRSFISLKAGKR